MLTQDEQIIFEAWNNMNGTQWTIWWCFNLAEKEIVNEEILNYISKYCGLSYRHVWDEIFKMMKKDNCYVQKENDGYYHFYMKPIHNYVPNNELTYREKIKQDLISQHPEWENLICVYGIYVNGILVYIGKTINYIGRCAEHYCQINFNNKEPKYILLKQLKDNNYEIATRPIQEFENEEEVKKYEMIYIGKYMPILNTQIPSEDPKKKFKIRSIQNLTYEDVVKYIKQQEATYNAE